MEHSERSSARKRAKLNDSSTHTVSVEDLPSAHAASSSVLDAQADRTDVELMVRGYFNEDFQPTPTTFPPGFRKVIRPSDLEGFMSVAATFRPLLPSSSYSSIYASLNGSRDVMLQKAGGAVCAAYEIAYGDQIAVFSAFMTSALNSQQIPFQPQTTLERVLLQNQEKCEDDKARLAQFVAMLPGFEDLCPADRGILLEEKIFISSLLHYMKYFHKGEYYCVMPGPEQIHVNRYWMELMGLDPELVRFCYHFSAVFNGIGLTLTESYLLMAAAFFDPHTTTASNKSLLGQLHTFYADALTYVIGTLRRDPVERAAVFHKLNQTAKWFPMVHQISRGWYNNAYVDRTLPPFPAPLRTLLQDCLKH
ncbi:uncharacterized protein LOC129588937 [Paramacrobiotus metropolitanus]|uniref:uncharacterized protein LOC129588937 n=1 Tax=Paramacrobiotus metropolitanus TaxID=2943436 RepID=UPI002446189C|nr:uncharacterized protein LOC129588937 [Paramacrobiotus metropolitanus]